MVKRAWFSSASVRALAWATALFVAHGGYGAISASHPQSRLDAFAGAPLSGMAQTDASALFIMAVLVCVAAILAAAISLRALRRVKNEQERLRRNAERFRHARRLSNEVLFVADPTHGRIEFDERARRVFGFETDAHDLISLFSQAGFVHAADLAATEAFLASMLSGEPNGVAEARLQCANGETRWFRLEYAFDGANAGHAMRVGGRMIDIEREKRTERFLRHRASCDPLTGLLNRASFEQRVQETLSCTRRDADAGATHAFMMVDLDDFKRVNDCHGHQAGDALLLRFGELLTGLFRAGDAVARMGGDEFAVLLCGVGDGALVQQRGETLCESMRSFCQETGFGVTISVGAALFPRDGDTFEALYARADEALYAAKRAGKNRFCLFGGDTPL